MSDKKNKYVPNFVLIDSDLSQKERLINRFKIYFWRRLNSPATASLLSSLAIIGMLSNTLLIIYFSSESQRENEQLSDYIVSADNREVMGIDDQVLTESHLRTTVSGFLNNQAFTEVGFKVKRTQNALVVQNDRNCQTSMPPSFKNGCYFVLAPNLLNFVNEDTVHSSIILSGEIPQQTKLIAYKIDYDSGTEEQLGSPLESSQNRFNLNLPSRFLPTEALKLNFQIPPGTQARISQIELKHTDASTFKAVSGKSPWFGKEARVYLDIDQNQVFDSGVDILWNCSKNKPGVSSVKLDERGQFSLRRDDSCISQKPKSWIEDDYQFALPPGNWLLVPNNNTLDYRPFAIKNDSNKQTTLNLQ